MNTWGIESGSSSDSGRSGRISSFTTTTGLCFEERKKIRKAKIQKKKPNDKLWK